MILYFEQKFANNNLKIQNFFKTHNESTLKKLFLLDSIDQANGSFLNRAGVGDFPLKNNFINDQKFAMPKYDPNFKKTWADVTDEHCAHLRSTRFDRHWVVLWSGGVDSTNVVAAIIKNLPRADFENITIACNSISIWENPQFYYNFIEPNFKTVDSHWAVTNACIDADNYLINGEPGDQLFAPGNLAAEIPHAILHQSPLNYDVFFNFIATNVNKKFAEWFCDFVVKNINSVDVPVNSLHDVIWWSHFNFNWVGIQMRFLHFGDWSRLKNAKVYFDSFIPWFNSKGYQQWAMVNNVQGEKFGSSFGDAKVAAKKYIYDLDKNKYYQTYKTKMKSIDITSSNYGSPGDWCCILDNYDLLNMRDHEDQILKLLPGHLNSGW